MILSFVIPCYGSEKTITNVINEINLVVSASEHNYEIVLVNDSSPDGVIEVIKKLALVNKKIKVLDLARNFGQHSALMAGYAHASGDIIISLDDDGQIPVNEVFNLITKLDEGYDVVIARYLDKKHNVFRNLGSYINDIMAQVLIGKPKDLYLSSFFVAKRFVINEMINYKNSYPYISGLLLRTTNKIANVDVTHRARSIGKSGYTFGKLLSLWINGFTAFSVKPLRISISLGAIFAVIGFVVGIYTVINKFLNPNVPLGWSSTTALLSFLGGIILIVLGMIGEYVGRIYISINNSPQYVIREKFNIVEWEDNNNENRRI